MAFEKKEEEENFGKEVPEFFYNIIKNADYSFLLFFMKTPQKT